MKYITSEEKFMDMLNISYKKDIKYIMLAGARMCKKSDSIRKFIKENNNE